MHADCLRRNHYRLVVGTPNANLVAGMGWLQSTYTIRLDARLHRWMSQPAASDSAQARLQI